MSASAEGPSDTPGNTPDPEIPPADELLPADAPPPLFAPPSPFAHPAWSVGVVLIFGVVSLFLGIVGHPVWLLLGSPFILTLLVWVGVKIALWRRRDDARMDDGRDHDV